MRKLELVAEADCRRLDLFLAENTSLTRSHIQRLIDKGGVFVAGKAAAKASTPVKTDCSVCVILPDEIPLDIPAEDIPLNIVYEDADLAVINKPQGLTVHPANNVNTGTLVNALLFHIKDLSGINGVLRPGIVHRLDKDTSGLLVIAKNDRAHLELQRQIQTKQCRRIYVALCEGVLKPDSGTVDQPIGRSHSDRKKMDVVADGRNAVTNFIVLERFASYTLVQFELKTGRTHQIRVHAKYLGHPVVGDCTYGFAKQRFALDGQLLHAQRLMFTHPTTGQQMSFFAPLPDYFERVLGTLRSKN